MRGWLVETVTDSGDMAFGERPDPVPGPGELLIRVEAAGVNFADTLMVRGRYQRKPDPPFTPGIEVAGEVVGGGGRVCAPIATGGFAELALAPAHAATPIPDDVPSDVALALLGVNYPTAWYALHRRAQLRAGETVLVHAGAGGVGSAAVQIARAHGCRVIALAGAADKLAVCRDLGAETVLSYETDDWLSAVRAATGGAGADVIFDPVGGRIGVDSLRALAWHGRLLTVGFAAGPIPELPANRLLLKEAAALGVFYGEAIKRDPQLARAVQAELLTLYRARQVDPLIGARFPLAQAPAALAALAARRSVGKIVLVPALDQTV